MSNFMINFIALYNCVFNKVLSDMHKILSLKDNEIFYIKVSKHTHTYIIYKSPI